MKRRLRKKLRVAEFREDCFELTFHLDPALQGDAIHAVTDDFIDMVESRGLQYCHFAPETVPAVCAPNGTSLGLRAGLLRSGTV